MGVTAMTYFDSTLRLPAGKAFPALEQTIHGQHRALASQIEIVSRALSETMINTSEVVSALQDLVKDYQKTFFE
jgi:hypothetical protein